jgi:endonuclease/exonuclease/phosphatase family metal-dependent hydrolase
MPLTLASFNVKDMFDATDPVSRGHLDAKLAAIGAVLARADADVVALQEVGSADVLRELCARFPGGEKYAVPIVGTADARGIRNAVLARVPVLHAEVKTADHLSFPTFAVGDPSPFGARIPLRRGVVHVAIDGGGLGRVDVLVAHFKSNRAVPLRDAAGEAIAPITSREYAEGNLRSLVWRASEALFVRGVVDGLLAESPSRHVLVAGDLNDHSGSQVVRTVTGGGPDALVRCAEIIPESERFSILRYGARQQIDHVLATQGLRARLKSARFLNEELRDHSAFTDDMPPSPDSDHAALVVSFA